MRPPVLPRRCRVRFNPKTAFEWRELQGRCAGAVSCASTLSAPSEKRNSLMPTAFCKSSLFKGGFRVQFRLKKIFKKLLDQRNIFRSMGSSIGKLT
jgi:hypothetical protein